MLPLPYLLVYDVFRNAIDNGHERRITTYLVLYLCGVIALQILGSFRAYHSWKKRDFNESIPPAPAMYEAILDADDDIASTSASATQKARNTGAMVATSSHHKATGDSLSIEEDRGSAIGRHPRYKKTSVPYPPNTFKFTAASNVIELCSLTLEFLQMASFALQSSPYSVDNTDDGGAGGTGDDDANEESSFWGAKLFKVLYAHVPGASDVQYGCMWGAVGVVGLLIVLFTTQFLKELRVYGSLMVDPAHKDKAKDSFFFSFTGAIVYGHGKPNNISKRMRLIVAVLSDALFLVVSFQLLKVFSCDYSRNQPGDGDTNDDYPVLRTDDSIVCWQGPHATLATVALICYSYYVPLSVMITPMLLENPSTTADAQVPNNNIPVAASSDAQGSNKSNGASETATPKFASSGSPSEGGVTYLKLYLMTLNVVKSVMLLVGVLGPESISTAVLSSCVASFVLGSITLLWFGQHDVTSSHYSADIHPCNIAFINYWKAASYTSAVASAVIILVAYYMQDTEHFPISVLTPVLIITWIIIIIVFVAAYRRFHHSVSSRRHIIEALIAYPFYFRDLREDIGGSIYMPGDSPAGSNGSFAQEGKCWLYGSPYVARNKQHIPGFVSSPWADSRDLESPNVVDVEGRSISPLYTITSLMIRRSYTSR